MDNNIPTSDEMWVQAIQLRVEDMLKTHPEIDEESLALLVETLGVGLRSHRSLLKKYQSGCSFIESDFYQIPEEEEDNTKLGKRKQSITKVSHPLPNGRSYSISAPFIKSKRSR